MEPKFKIGDTVKCCSEKEAARISRYGRGPGFVANKIFIVRDFIKSSHHCGYWIRESVDSGMGVNEKLLTLILDADAKYDRINLEL